VIDHARYRFALVAHSAEIVDSVQRVARYEDYDLDCQVATFEAVVPAAEKYLEDGYDVVLCHGGTGNSIVRNIGHSVSVIDRTDMDVVKTLRKASSLSKTIALASYLEEKHDTREIEELLRITIHHIVYATWEELFSKVKDAYAQGVHVLVGGGISKKSMENQGGVGFVIEPNPHSIQNALDSARALARHKRIEAARHADLVAIFKHVQDGVVCIDTERNIVFSNQKAEALLKLRPGSRPEALREFHDKLLLTSVLGNEVARHDVVREIAGEQFVVTTLPLLVHSGAPGAVAFFRDVPTLQKINRKISEELYVKGFVVRSGIADIQGGSEAIRDVKRKIARFAPTSATVLITGETGVGKELVAHALHAESRRPGKAFVAVNCAAIPQGLIESELFGYEDGAFTGAKRGGKIGLFEMADGGTIFLDEVGDVSPEMQLRLLRVLESREIMRLGGSRIRTVDVRVISASHRPLLELVRSGAFRQDLYYRLSTLKVTVPPLRERLEDIPSLLEKPLSRYGKSGRSISQGMLKALGSHGWPGNVRELMSMIETYLVLLEGQEANEALFREIFRESSAAVGSQPPEADPADAGLTLKQSLERLRVSHIREMVGRCGGDKNEAARRLGVSYTTVWRVLHEHGLG
jgi:transcriptional regulator, propionate catabolism operon regulatory protein